MQVLVWIFLLSLPIGLFVGFMFLAARVLRDSTGTKGGVPFQRRLRPEKRSPSDPPGAKEPEFSAGAEEVLLAELRSAVPGVDWVVTDGDPRRLELPASNPQLGSLSIWTSDWDYVVGLGELFHRHFDPSIEADPRLSFTDRRRQAAQEAARFVRDVVAEKVGFRGTYKNDALIAMSSFHIDGSDKASQRVYPMTLRILKTRIFGGKAMVREMTWRGPRP